jgi:glycosyltransferase involved in cell wall biosynthesis
MARPVIVIAGKDPTLVDGGSESYLRAYGRAAVSVGYEPHHFCVSDRSDVETTEYGIVHRTRSPFRPIRGLMVAAHQPFVVDCVDRFVQNGAEPRLIHSFGPWCGVGVAAARQLRKRGIESVTLATAYGTYRHEALGKLRGLGPERPLLLRLQHWWELLWIYAAVEGNERRGFIQSQRVLLNYDSVRQIIAAQIGPGVRFGKMTYCSEAAFRPEDAPRATPPDPIAALKPRDAPLIISVSRHDPRKGLDVLLHALAQLHRGGLRFRACLVGGGPLLDIHRRLAERLGLANCTAIVGRVPDAYVYLQQADVFVLPSLEEGSGSVSLLEAMQAAAAPVVSRVDGLPEDVVEGESALLVEPGDPGALAAALTRVLADAALRQRLAQGAHARYRERFSAAAFAADLRSIYTSVGFAPA